MFIVTDLVSLKEMKRFVIKWLHVKHENKTYDRLLVVIAKCGFIVMGHFTLFHHTKFKYCFLA